MGGGERLEKAGRRQLGRLVSRGEGDVDNENCVLTCQETITVAGLWNSVQFFGNSRANHSRHCSAVQAAFSSMTGLALGRLRRFSTVNRRGSRIVCATSQ